MKPRGKVFIISGPSGVGKTTIAEAILKELKDVRKTISCTTRGPRKGERDGKDYRFLAKEEFEKLIKKGAFLEWASILGNLYGTLKAEVDGILRGGKDALLCIDVQGAKQVKEKLPQAISIFILPPNLGELKKRLIKRGEEEKEVERRLKLAKREVKEIYRYDYYVVNDDLKKAIELVKYIICAEKNRVEREKAKEVLKDVLREVR